MRDRSEKIKKKREKVSEQTSKVHILIGVEIPPTIKVVVQSRKGMYSTPMILLNEPSIFVAHIIECPVHNRGYENEGCWRGPIYDPC